jgi:hypothetical protein
MNSALKLLKKQKRRLEEEMKGHRESQIFFLEKSEWHKNRLVEAEKEIRELSVAIRKLGGKDEIPSGV